MTCNKTDAPVNHQLSITLVRYERIGFASLRVEVIDEGVFQLDGWGIGQWLNRRFRGRGERRERVGIGIGRKFQAEGAVEFERCGRAQTQVATQSRTDDDALDAAEFPRHINDFEATTSTQTAHVSLGLPLIGQGGQEMDASGVALEQHLGHGSGVCGIGLNMSKKFVAQEVERTISVQESRPKAGEPCGAGGLSGCFLANEKLSRGGEERAVDVGRDLAGGIERPERCEGFIGQCPTSRNRGAEVGIVGREELFAARIKIVFTHVREKVGFHSGRGCDIGQRLDSRQEWLVTFAQIADLGRPIADREARVVAAEVRCAREEQVAAQLEVERGERRVIGRGEFGDARGGRFLGLRLVETEADVNAVEGLAVVLLVVQTGQVVALLTRLVVV